jgi:uncharacterized phage-like protein YoqJ
MLIISNLSTIVLVQADQEIYLRINHLDEAFKNTTLWVWVGGISLAIQGMLFNVANWLFASEYLKTAILMPLAIEGFTWSGSQRKRYDRMQKTLTTINIISPLF